MKDEEATTPSAEAILETLEVVFEHKHNADAEFVLVPAGTEI